METQAAGAAAAAGAAKSLQYCSTLCSPIDGNPTWLLRPWDSPGKNTGVGCHCPLQEIQADTVKTNFAPNLKRSQALQKESKICTKKKTV